MRLGFVYIPNARFIDVYLRDRGSRLSPILRPLAPVRDHFTVERPAHRRPTISATGTAPRAGHRGVARAFTRGIAIAAALRRPPGTSAVNRRASVSAKTHPTSLEMTLESPTQIGCDSEDCFFSNTISWKSPTTPLPMEPHPRMVFERLFGQASTPAQRVARMRKTSSILDSVLDEVSALQKTLGAGDRSKLNEYLEAVTRSSSGSAAPRMRRCGRVAMPSRPDDIPESFEDYVI